MRILINAYSARVGGGRTYLINLLNNLPDNDDIEIFIHAPEDLDIPVDRRINRLRTKFPTKNPFGRLFWEFFVLPLELHRLEIDVLFCPGGVVNSYSPKRCKVVTMFRNMLPFDCFALSSLDGNYLKVKNFLLRRSMLRSMEGADLVIFISRHAREVVESLASIKKGITIYHGISSHFSVSDLALDRPSLPFQGEYILYVSRFESYKRHFELVNAYALLPDSIRAKYKLLVVGGGDEGGERRKILTYIEENKLVGSVFLLGEHPYMELPALYRHASLFVFPSVCENCPNILLEAMGAGVPIVCSEYQPMPEFGRDSLVYVSPDVPAQMSQKMGVLLSDPLLRDEYAKKSSQRAKLYSWSETARTTWNALFSI